MTFKNEDIFNIRDEDDESYKQLVVTLQQNQIDDLEEVWNEYNFTSAEFNLSLCIRAAIQYFMECYRNVERY
jgi:hypothetical protein